MPRGRCRPGHGRRHLRPAQARPDVRATRRAVGRGAGLALLAAEVAAYYLIPRLYHPHAARRGQGRRPGGSLPRQPRHPANRPVAALYAHTVVIRLAAIEDCWVQFTTVGGGYRLQSYVADGTSKAWSFPTPWPCGWVIAASCA